MEGQLEVCIECRIRRCLRFYARREVNSCAAGTWHFRSLIVCPEVEKRGGALLALQRSAQGNLGDSPPALVLLLPKSHLPCTQPQKPHERKTIPDLVFQPLQFDHSGGSPNPLKAGIPSLQIKETHLHGDPSLKVNCKTNTLRLNTPAALPP